MVFFCLINPGRNPYLAEARRMGIKKQQQLDFLTNKIINGVKPEKDEKYMYYLFAEWEIVAEISEDSA